MTSSNIFHLGLKELRSLWRDPVMIVLIIYAFSLQIYAAALAIPDSLHNTPISVVDEDHSPLSERIFEAFYPPRFLPPRQIGATEMDARMDAGLDTFALDIPPDFQRDLLAGRKPTIQLNVDATRMVQALSGSSYVQTMVGDEVRAYLQRHGRIPPSPVTLVPRVQFNPQLDKFWFSAITELINSVTTLSIVLTGAALIREREHGTVEHLLVMPVTPFEIMAAKVWSMGLVVLVSCALSLMLIVQGIMQVPVAGSVLLFLTGTILHLFATTSLGIVLGTLARSMPQFGLLMVLVILPLYMLSGGITPRESMPAFIQMAMLAAPTTHFVMLAQGILFRGAGLDVVWPHLLAITVIGTMLFGAALAHFRKAIATMA